MTFDSLQNESEAFRQLIEPMLEQAQENGISSLGILSGLTSTLASVIAVYAHPNTLENRIICANQMRDVMVGSFEMEEQFAKAKIQ